MARGDVIKVVGIEKVSKDLNNLFAEFKTKRVIVDRSSRESLKPIKDLAKAVAPVADQDLPRYFSLDKKTGNRYPREPIPRGTLQRSIKFRKRKNWIGVIIEHGKTSFKNDAWFWRFSEYGFMWQGWGAKVPKWIPGKHMFRSAIGGTQKRVLNAWLRIAKKEMKNRIPKMDTRIK